MTDINTSFNQADADLMNDIKRNSAYNSSEISLFDQKTRRELWQSVFYKELQNHNKSDRIDLASAKADEAVDAYDKKFGIK